MRLFIDPADPAQWARLAKTGLIHGATTNPILFEREGIDAGQAKIELVGRPETSASTSCSSRSRAVRPSGAVAAFMAVRDVARRHCRQNPLRDQTWEITALDSAVPLTFTTGFA